MKKILVSVITLFTLLSCGASQPMRVYGKSNTHKNSNSNGIYDGYNNGRGVARTSNDGDPAKGKAAKILDDAEKYLGTPYRPGGMTSSGFDCSGFVNRVFDENGITLTRRSADQAKEGVSVSVSRVKHGDLLFFATAGGKRVSHVGIVHTISNNGEIKFIHASTSKGVIISSLEEKYWNNAFLFARRVL